MSRPTVLIVDDEPDIRELLSMTLEGMDIAPDTAADLAEARQKLQLGDFHFCLTDMRLPDGDGLELVQWMQSQRPGVPVAVITAHGNVETAVRALKLGAYDFVSKPVRVKDLRKLVTTALKLREVEQRDVDSTAMRGNRQPLLGDSPPMERLRKMISKVARSQAPVHIVGDSGTGKELVARLIHDSGPRAGGPFVAVNCGAIPSELMESELFGHLKGSFTGATADHEGLIRSAEGGTVLLDEIAELPLLMQVKLLRVIQERAVRPVGGNQEIPVDVRFLSATHQDLGALVADGRFREDLYYRINVIELVVPPLRDRGDDILELAEHILDRLAAQLGVECRELSAGAKKALLAHSFPGNVRELENVLERAIALCEDGRIEAEDIQLRQPEPGQNPVRPRVSPGGENGLGDQVEELERAAIIQALEQTRYNKTQAARQLGITFRALRYRIKKLGIE
ncbi:sigma-54 dependent transcriptional regulator [Wenzhouxiangella sp. XN24]|uniref:sigma 54-interacting transcriptional regulator n=1 Tax=Wenzhouxiangella sp. XN24 TaxID=2713569 RepID=UPI0013ED20F7|nr:sigma-54-dependent Fis family transcriptional regulator [Wenzhouxiangella sp. XN24]